MSDKKEEDTFPGDEEDPFDFDENENENEGVDVEMQDGEKAAPAGDEDEESVGSFDNQEVKGTPDAGRDSFEDEPETPPNTRTVEQEDEVEREIAQLQDVDEGDERSVDEQQEKKAKDEEPEDDDGDSDGNESRFGGALDLQKQKHDSPEEADRKKKIMGVSLICCFFMLLFAVLGVVLAGPTDRSQVIQQPAEPETEPPTSSAPTAEGETWSPTESPTPLPTAEPTESPTNEPTVLGQTDSPTTLSPTDAPTPFPTSPPTDPPTPFPTVEQGDFPENPTRSEDQCSVIKAHPNVTTGGTGGNNFAIYDDILGGSYCGDTFAGIDPENLGRSHWAARQGRDDCPHVGYIESLELCLLVGGRLCTADELGEGVAQGTGCNGDAEFIWSGTDCNEQGVAGKLTVNFGLRSSKDPFFACETDINHPTLIRCCGDA